MPWGTWFCTKHLLCRACKLQESLVPLSDLIWFGHCTCMLVPMVRGLSSSSPVRPHPPGHQPPGHQATGLLRCFHPFSPYLHLIRVTYVPARDGGRAAAARRQGVLRRGSIWRRRRVLGGSRTLCGRRAATRAGAAGGAAMAA